jgi:hypothetical protein
MNGINVLSEYQKLKGTQNGPDRTLIWFSGGAASAVAAWLRLRRAPDGCIIVRCETNNEDPDNHRFERAVMEFLGRKITILQSDKYESVPDVWDRRQYMAGPDGATCTLEMKVKPRLAFQRPTDAHVFGYTADAADVQRFKRLQNNYPELKVIAPLIDAGVTKVGALAIVQRWAIDLPRSYAMGFPNANCLQTGCCKAASPDYWALYRQRFPENFGATAARSRALGVRLARINGERVFIDEIPADWPTTEPVVPNCDFLCHIAAGEPT